MKLPNSIFFLVAFALCSFTSLHKYYISVTQIDFIESKKAIQITSRIFIDDMERLLQERYDESIILTENDDLTKVDAYLENYFKQKLKIEINNRPVNFNYLGKEYDTDIMKCYLEIENVDEVKTLKISNEVLFDLYEDQQNIVKTKIYSKQKSIILYKQNPASLLNFN